MTRDNDSVLFFFLVTFACCLVLNSLLTQFRSVRLSSFMLYCFVSDFSLNSHGLRLNGFKMNIGAQRLVNVQQNPTNYVKERRRALQLTISFIFDVYSSFHYEFFDFSFVSCFMYCYKVTHLLHKATKLSHLMCACGVFFVRETLRFVKMLHYYRYAGQTI